MFLYWHFNRANTLFSIQTSLYISFTTTFEFTVEGSVSIVHHWSTVSWHIPYILYHIIIIPHGIYIIFRHVHTVSPTLLNWLFFQTTSSCKSSCSFIYGLKQQLQS